VMLLGCEPDRCQFGIDTALVEEECDRARMILRLLGLRDDRLVLARVTRGDGAAFVDRLTSFMAGIEEMDSVATGGA